MTHVRASRKTGSGLSLDVDLVFDAPVTALYGPPGAGKTLLLEIIAGLGTPDFGRILLNDAILFDAAARVNVPPRRRCIGYVFQRLALFPHMTLERNVAFAARAWPRLERHRRLSEMLERFDLTSAAGLLPSRASHEQQVGCAAARALIADPKLLLIDDAGIGESLLARIRESFKNPIVMVTGDLDLCVSSASDLVLLEAGRVVQRGDPRELLEAPESVEAARLLGIPNVFEATILALDPSRKSSRLDFGAWTLNGPHIPGHFRGDRVSIAVRPDALRVHSGKEPAAENCVPAALARISRRARYVRLEFEGGIFADVSHEEYARQKDNPGWQVEFPAGSLRVL